MGAQNINSSNVIPVGEIRRFEFGGTHTEVLEQVFGGLPNSEPERDNNPKHEQAHKIVRDLIVMYYHQRRLDTFLFDGLIDGLSHFERLLHYFTFENAVRKAHTLVFERFNAVHHIEAVFIVSSENSNRASNANPKRVSQTGAEISENESYVFAVREGLRYALVRALSLCPQTSYEPAGTTFGDLKRLEANDALQIEFVRNTQPNLSTKYLDHIDIKCADIATFGWAATVEFIRCVSMFEVWKRKNQSLYNAISDPFENRFRRILADTELQTLFVRALRANKQMFHIIRLGCGIADAKPEDGNFVFDLRVSAETVPTWHIKDLFNRLQTVKEQREGARVG